MTISELARVTDTAAPTIRFYEQIGLLPQPTRTPGNYRDYTDEDVARLTFIRHARELDFSIEHIRQLLVLADQKEQSCDAVYAIATVHLLEVRQKISRLKALSSELATIIDRCRHGTIGDCAILEALTS